MANRLPLGEGKNEPRRSSFRCAGQRLADGAFGLNGEGAPLGLDYPWLRQIVATINANKAQVTKIETCQNNEALVRFALHLKPTHCPSALKHAKAVLTVDQSGGAHLDVWKAKSSDQVKAHLSAAQQAVLIETEMMTQAQAFAESPAIFEKLYANPWAVYAARFFLPLPAKLVRLAFCQTEKHNNLKLTFNGSADETEGLCIGVNINAYGHSQTLNLSSSSEKDGALSPAMEEILLRYSSAARECAQSIAHGHALLERAEDIPTNLRRLFLNPGLISCLNITSREGARVKSIGLSRTQDGKKRATLFLENDQWRTKNGLVRMTLGDNCVLSHNVTGGNLHALGRAVSDLTACIGYGDWLSRPPRRGKDNRRTAWAQSL